MDLDIAFTCLLIFLARVGDVSLGTIRTIMVIHGRRVVASLLGFVEVLIWVLAVSQVVSNLERPVYALAYAGGFAAGCFVGITIENIMAIGQQVVRVFTRLGVPVAERLRLEGFRVTELEGKGRDGAVGLLFIETSRRDAMRAAKAARAVDPGCYFVVDDIRLASRSLANLQGSNGTTAIKKK
jgi:uncharacterized protein YebE (UPF0316 family)